jgi:hypothetical protein
MVTSTSLEVEEEIKAIQAEHEMLEDTPEDFFEKAPYHYKNNYGVKFAAIIEEDSVLFTKDDQDWGNKLLRFSKGQAEEAIIQLKKEQIGKLDRESINMHNPINRILISIGETLFLASVLQTALEKWRSPKK